MNNMSRDIKLSEIRRNEHQSRKYFNDGLLQELADSMKENGLASPILVRPEGQEFVIVSGERRYRAAQLLGWETIPAVVRDLNDKHAERLALIENIQRADLTPTEEARAIRAMLDDGTTQMELGKAIGKSQSYIAQKLRILKLPQPVLLLLDEEGLTEGHVRQLMRLRDFYGGVEEKMLIKNLPKPKNDEDENAKQSFVRAWLVTHRPFGRLCSILPDQARVGVCWEAVKFWEKYLIKYDGILPAWERVATWFAVLTTASKESVANLSRIITLFFDLARSSLAWWTVMKTECAGETKLEREIARRRYWGYRTELKQAGLLDPETGELRATDEMIGEACGYLARDLSFLEPTELTAWAEAEGVNLALLY